MPSSSRRRHFHKVWRAHGLREHPAFEHLVGDGCGNHVDERRVRLKVVVQKISDWSRANPAAWSIVVFPECIQALIFGVTATWALALCDFGKRRYDAAALQQRPPPKGLAPPIQYGTMGEALCKSGAAGGVRCR